jgi:DNA helicase-2/ATP-dependent DNA helicase PcrA
VLDLTRLTDEQRRVVLAPDGPLLVVAGPGSGKTTVLAGRVAHLVADRGVGPATVLALTFTTAAARELRARLVRVLGEPGRAVEVGTYHSFGLRIVRQWSEELGYGPGPLAVYDHGDALRLLRQAAAEAGVDADRWPPGEFWRALERHRLGGDDPGTAGPLAAIAEAYEALLRRRAAVDFPAMLALPLRLLAAHPRVLGLLQGAYRHVLADELQDACGAQYGLLRLLAGGHRALAAVGDPWQALYTWRGADGRVFDGFRADFPEARVLALSENFRATGRLVALANAVGAPLGDRRLWTRNPPGESAVLHAAADEAAEAAYVARESARLLAEGAVAGPGEIAVLYRTNHQVEELALALRAQGLPYRVRGAGDPFGRREVRDLLAYLRLALDPADGAALARIADTPPRRLGRLAAHLRAHPCGLDQLPDVARRFGPAAEAAAGSLSAVLDELRAASRGYRPSALLDLLLERSGYRAWLLGQPDGGARLAHLEVLRSSAGRAVGDPGDWLDGLRLGEDDGAHEGSAVLLTTVHLAKGNEWRVVFVVGVEEGLLPHARALAAAEPAGVEDELRVAYVAVTRACERLYVTCCRTRRLGDRVVPRHPSRFLRAVPRDLLTPTASAA